MLQGVGISLSVALGVAMLRRRRLCPKFDERRHFLCTEAPCPLCSCSIGEDKVEDVQVSVICADCTVQYFGNKDSIDEHIYIVSERHAIRELGSLPTDLSHLRPSHFLKIDEPIWERWYLRSDVWYLRNLRRQEEVERGLRFKLKDIHPLIRHFLLGDYLASLGNSETKLKQILMYEKVIHRATEIVKQCPSAHPKAALDFCVMHPEDGPAAFQEMKDKMNKVFRLEGRRILYGLTENERGALKDGPLRNVYNAFCAEEPEAIIRGHLSGWFNKASVDAIMDDDGWKTHDWATGPEDRIASRLKDFWEGKLRRKAKLIKILTARGLPMPESCFDCEGYLNGVSTLNMKEIVSVVELTHRLSTLGFRDGNLGWCIGFDRLFRCLKRQQMGRAKSVNKAVRAAIQSVKRQTE